MSKDSSSNDEQISTSAKPATISQSVSLLDRSEEIKRKLDAWKNLGEAARDLQQKILKHRTQKAPAGLSKSKASESAKNQPLSILTSADEALREVPSDDWKIGFDKSGKFKKRIIVLEENDKNLAREYRNYGKLYVTNMICLGCTVSKNSSKGINKAKWIDGKLFVPTSKIHICKPKLVKEINLQQKQYNKNIGKRKPEDSSNNDSTYLNLEMVVAGPQINDANTINLDHEVPAVLKSPNVPLQALSGIVEKDVVDSSENITSSGSALNTSDFPVMFYHPSSHYLKECCKKFELDYFHLAYAFWAKMKIGEIAHDSIPEDFHSLLTEKSNGFNCLSSYLTGSEENGDYIKNKLNGFVLDNIVALGQKLGIDLSTSSHPMLQECITSINPHQLHLEVFCLLCNCRIFIFADGIWKRYGKATLEDIPIFLMAVENGKYRTVLRFKS